MKIKSYNMITAKSGSSIGFSRLIDKIRFTSKFWTQVVTDIRASGKTDFEHEHKAIIRQLRLSINRQGKISAITYNPQRTS